MQDLRRRPRQQGAIDCRAAHGPNVDLVVDASSWSAHRGSVACQCTGAITLGCSQPTQTPERLPLDLRTPLWRDHRGQLTEPKCKQSVMN